MARFAAGLRWGILEVFMACASVEPLAARELTAREVFDRSHAAVVTIGITDLFGKSHRGTGFFISPNLIATNQHVVKDARDFAIRQANGPQTFTFVRVRATDHAADTAVIEVKERSGSHLRLDPITRMQVGDPVFVIGNPEGYAASLSQGLVSGIRVRNDTPMYQITANVAQGSSGSPVIDSHGRAVGIVFGRLPREAQIAFATPAANLAALTDGSWRPATAGATPPTSRNLSTDIDLSALHHRESPAGNAGEPLRIGVPNWDSGIVVGYILHEAIERLLRVPVELVPAANDDILAGIEASDRSFDIHPDVWLPNHRPLLTEQARLTKPSYAATQGICVPRYVLSRFSVAHRMDLARPAVARLFDRDEDGRGELWIGEEGWQSAKIERLKARDYRYEPFFDLVTGPERELYRRLDEAIAAQRPIAFFCYGPHWVLRHHDLVMLQERPHSSACFRLAEGVEGVAWYDGSHASCAGPNSTAHIAYSRRVAERLPRVAALLESLSLDYEELSRLIFDMVGGGRDNRTVARLWVERNEGRLRSAMENAAAR